MKYILIIGTLILVFSSLSSHVKGKKHFVAFLDLKINDIDVDSIDVSWFELARNLN